MRRRRRLRHGPLGAGKLLGAALVLWALAVAASHVLFHVAFGAPVDVALGIMGLIVARSIQLYRRASVRRSCVSS